MMPHLPWQASPWVRGGTQPPPPPVSAPHTWTKSPASPATPQTSPLPHTVAQPCSSPAQPSETKPQYPGGLSAVISSHVLGWQVIRLQKPCTQRSLSAQVTKFGASLQSSTLLQPSFTR